MADEKGKDAPVDETETPDKPTGDKNGEPTDDTTDEGKNKPDSDKPDADTEKDKRFSQADLNRFLAEEKRKLKKQQEDDEKKKKGEFQELYATEQTEHLKTKQELWRLRAASELELDAEWVDLLTGESEDEIKSSAKALKTRLEKLAKKNGSDKGPGTPRHQKADDTGGAGDKDAKEKTATAMDKLFFGSKRD